MAIVEHLQEDIEHIGMRLLDLVKQHDGIRRSAHLLAELSALLEAYVSRGGAYHLGDGMGLHILRHIHPDQGVLRAEHRLCKRLGQLGLTHAGRP